ncbi:MAG: prepilin-type N-terminal cleavage/methylation domain-containing protein [Planctomycetota bacterium]
MNRTRAFSLLEVMVVVVVIGVLAAVVVPVFGGVSGDARSAALESAVGGVRSSIGGFRTEAILAGSAPYPTADQLRSEGVVVRGGLPANPYSGLSTLQEVTSAQAEARAVVNAQSFGWNYYVDNASDPPVAVFYANSSDETRVEDSDGSKKDANQV